MIKERSEQVVKILNEQLQKNKENGKESNFIGVDIDPVSKQSIGYHMQDLERDSETVKKLEDLGFKAIYPAELSEEAISKMSDADKYVYEKKMKSALFIDGKEPNLSLEFAKKISDHYLSADDSMKFWGLDIDNNSIEKYMGEGNHKEGTAENLQEILNEVGFNPTLDDKSINISSDIPYPAVKKSKFEQIYDKAKGRIQGAFAKLKSFVHTKDQVKDNDVNERE